MLAGAAGIAGLQTQDLIVQRIGVGLVEEKAHLDHGLIFLVERHTSAFIDARRDGPLLVRPCHRLFASGGAPLADYGPSHTREPAYLSARFGVKSC